MAEKRLFCFGLGYSARHLAERLQHQGWQVAGTCRSAEAEADLAAAGIAAARFDGAAPMDKAGRGLLSKASHVLSSVPPDEAGDPVLAHHRADLIGHDKLSWIGYLSTTGVYGDRGGDWVDEETPPEPATERGRRRHAAERDWLALHAVHGLPVHLFRLAGIYGPGRNPLAALKEGRGRRVIKPGQVFSRIHVEDIARVLEASMENPHPGRVYNVCDDAPAPSHEVTAFAAGLMGVAPPPAVPFEEADLSPMAKSFYADNKRVANGRIKEELGVHLAYPSYREGLAALLAADG